MEVIFPESRDITIVAAVSPPPITAREEARTVISGYCGIVAQEPFGGVGGVGAGVG